MRRKILTTLVLLTASVSAHADAALQDFLSTTLASARDKGHLPAVAAMVQIDRKIEAQAAIGVRELGHPETVGLDDRWHLGSDTKAMTSTMIARLVEGGVMRFDETLDQLFPGIAGRMDPALSKVTLTQLLSHTSGLAPLSDDKEMTTFLAVLGRAKGVRAQRASVVVHYLTRPPASKAGEFVYSNLGYTIAGAAAEARTGHTWEELIEREVWKPLGIRSGGFGAPGKPKKIDQPRGHEDHGGKLQPLEPGTVESDNPPAIGPAGTVNMSLGDWMLFAQDQLDGIHGHGKLLKTDSYRKLQTAVTRNYGLGWGVLREDDNTIKLLTHTGSNGFWISDVRIYPRRNAITLIVTNAGGKDAETATRDIGKALQEKLKPFD